MEKIFEDFKQVDAKKNRGVEGTGLGLSITKRLVQLMKGSIRVESVYGEVLRKLKGEQLIEEVAGYVRLTEHGIDVSNYVLAEFLL